MRFLAALSTLLLGASLTAPVLAAPKPIENHLERRFQNLDDDIKADKATWEYFAGKCGGGSSKRSLDKRSDVAMGDSAEMHFPLGLSTGGLKPCLGVVITGQDKGGRTFRVLGHFTASLSGIEPQWQKFKSEYEKAGEIDKDTTRGYMSVPDYDADTSQFYGDKGSRNKDAVDLSKEFESELKKRVDDLVNGNPSRHPRNVDKAATMEVNANNEVFVDGVRLN
jgi:hypothetical protein